MEAKKVQDWIGDPLGTQVGCLEFYHGRILSNCTCTLSHVMTTPCMLPLHCRAILDLQSTWGRAASPHTPAQFLRPQVSPSHISPSPESLHLGTIQVQGKMGGVKSAWVFSTLCPAIASARLAHLPCSTSPRPLFLCTLNVKILFHVFPPSEVQQVGMNMRVRPSSVTALGTPAPASPLPM